MKMINKKHIVYLGLTLALAVVGAEAFADASTAAATTDAATQLTPMFDKIINSLSGTLGKVIMGVGFLLSGIAALAGMNKAVIMTPIGTGFFLGNAKTLINWIFG